MKIVIGNATLYLGRCENLLPVIGPVDALVIDPPYLFDASGGGKYRRRRKNMDDIIASELNKGFDINIIDPKLYKSVVSFCHNDQLNILLPFFAKHYKRHAVCFWEKSNPMPVANRHYQANLEPYIHAWNKDAHPVGTLAELKRTVLTAVGKSKFDHPTVKPDAVMNKILTNVNAQTVLDCFMGTGSTGIAALNHGKKFIGIEKCPATFNIACQRFYDLYSFKVTHARGNG